jgi:hypothetical protein
MSSLKVWNHGCLFLMGFGLILCESKSLGETVHFALPSTVTAENNPDNCRWGGMDAEGHWQVDGQPITVDPQRWLTQFPPGPCSAVILPTAHWVELTFAGSIIDGNTPHPCLKGLPDGTDLVVLEKDANQERTVIFLTDGVDRLFLLGEAYASLSHSVPDPNCPGMVKIGFDLTDVNVPFTPRSVRILSRSLGGGAPGFDLGRVWARIEPLPAPSCPWPLDGAQDIAPEVTLTWAAGHHAVGHALTLGPDPDALDRADPVMVFLGDEPLAFSPETLRLGETLYWRVDAIPDSNDNALVAGPVWSFTTASTVTIDDFEFYDYIHPFDDVWLHQPGTHALVQVPPHPERPGCQYMTVTYDNTQSGRTLERFFIPTQDWLAYPEATELAFDFRGDPNNRLTSRLTAFVGDGAMTTITPPYDGPREFLNDGQWHSWSIPLSMFNLIDLTHVAILGFMVTSGATPHDPDLSYRMDFDNIRLRRPQTDPNHEPLPPDPAPARPSAIPEEPNAPRAWYAFDEAYYYQIIDHQRNFPGYWAGSNSPLVYASGKLGNAIQLLPTDGHIALNAPLGISHFLEGISIAFWQNGANTLYDTDTLCCAEPRYDEGGPALGIALGCWERPGRAIWRCGDPDGLRNHLEQKHSHVSEWMGVWNHWVFTKDFRSGRMTVYHNGVPWAQKQGLPGRLPAIYDLTFGNGWLNGHDGWLDELRIYDYALSEGEAAFLADDR